MPSNASQTGALSLPLPAGAPNAALRDPLLDGLLDYFAFWLAADLNAKLASMAGQPHAVLPAAPAGQFPFNPERTFVRTSIPALYMWRDEGQDGERYEQHTILRLRRISLVHALYIFSEQTIPAGGVVQSGLRNAVDASLRAATEYGYRTDYGHNAPLGTPIKTSLKFDGWVYLGCEGGIMWKLPGEAVVSPTAATGGDGAVQRGFPAVRAHWEIHEQPALRAADAPLGDRHVTVDGEGVELLHRIVHP